MLVKAKWNVKDGNGWHRAGEVFHTESNLGSAVEVIDAPKKPVSAKAEPGTSPEPKAPEKAAQEPEKAAAKPRTASRRKRV